MCTIRARFIVGQHVRISKEIKFEKGAEKNFSREIFRINKVIKRTPRPVYELEDTDRRSILLGRTNSCAHHKTVYKIDKILD